MFNRCIANPYNLNINHWVKDDKGNSLPLLVRSVQIKYLEQNCQSVNELNSKIDVVIREIYDQIASSKENKYNAIGFPSTVIHPDSAIIIASQIYTRGFHSNYKCLKYDPGKKKNMCFCKLPKTDLDNIKIINQLDFNYGNALLYWTAEPSLVFNLFKRAKLNCMNLIQECNYIVYFEPNGEIHEVSENYKFREGKETELKINLFTGDLYNKEEKIEEERFTRIGPNLFIDNKNRNEIYDSRTKRTLYLDDSLLYNKFKINGKVSKYIPCSNFIFDVCSWNSTTALNKPENKEVIDNYLRKKKSISELYDNIIEDVYGNPSYTKYPAVRTKNIIGRFAQNMANINYYINAHQKESKGPVRYNEVFTLLFPWDIYGIEVGQDNEYISDILRERILNYNQEIINNIYILMLKDNFDEIIEDQLNGIDFEDIKSNKDNYFLNNQYEGTIKLICLFIYQCSANICKEQEIDDFKLNQDVLFEFLNELINMLKEPINFFRYYTNDTSSAMIKLNDNLEIDDLSEEYDYNNFIDNDNILKYLNKRYKLFFISKEAEKQYYQSIIRQIDFINKIDDESSVFTIDDMPKDLEVEGEEGEEEDSDEDESERKGEGVATLLEDSLTEVTYEDARAILADMRTSKKPRKTKFSSNPLAYNLFTNPEKLKKITEEAINIEQQKRLHILITYFEYETVMEYLKGIEKELIGLIKDKIILKYKNILPPLKFYDQVAEKSYVDTKIRKYDIVLLSQKQLSNSVNIFRIVNDDEKENIVTIR